MRALRKGALIAETRTEPRRGALEHFYRRTPLGDELAAIVSDLLGIPRRGPGRPASRNCCDTSAYLLSRCSD